MHQTFPPPVRSFFTRFFGSAAAFCFAIALANGLVRAEEVDDEDLPPYLPGLVATYQAAGSPSETSGQGFVRIEDILSHQWADSVDPRLRPGPFQATWTGRLLTPEEGEYRLAVFAEGDVRVSLENEVVLEGNLDKPGWIESKLLDLPFGRHPLEVHYEGRGSGQVALYWKGPKFSLEPIGSQFLLHRRQDTTSNPSQRGAELVRALRCSACHQINGESIPLAAPDLRKVAGSIHPSWLKQWLAAKDHATMRRMPQFQWGDGDIEAIVAFLASSSPGETSTKSPKPPSTSDKDREAGRSLVHHIGCLACHQINQVGSDDVYGGGDLSLISAKRPPSFFSKWLQSPAALNADHRMPVFDLSKKERAQISGYLSSLGKPTPSTEPPRGSEATEAMRQRGRKLLASRGCVQCHQVEAAKSSPPPDRSRLQANSRWTNSCMGDPAEKRPGYRLPAEDALAIETYIKELALYHPRDAALMSTSHGAQLLRETNCIACHQRNGALGLAAMLGDLAEAHPQWAPRLPAMRPPSLNAIGDKLHDEALKKTIGRDAPRRRPWLDVRMPRFALSDEELTTIVAHFVQEDRIPSDAPLPDGLRASNPHADSRFTPKSSQDLLDIAGRRLVTADGFGCTSCHAVGSVKPSKAPINATGADLLMLGQRIRRDWFDRWVRNPARIVPRMEMPSVQRPIHGVLDNQLDEQLAAVWHVLNQPDFVPPEPNPVRIVRRSNASDGTIRPAVVTDVIHLGERVLVKPLLVGLANRHNLLYDLETGAVRGWWTGDTARQHTKGKTWMWKPGAPNLLDDNPTATPEISLQGPGGWLEPKQRGQFVTEFDAIEFTDDRVIIQYRLDYPTADGEVTSISVTETISPLGAIGEGKGVRRQLSLEGPSRKQVRLAPPLSPTGPKVCETKAGDRIEFSGSGQWSAKGLELTLDGRGRASVEITYASGLAADQFLTPPPQGEPPAPETLSILPGFTSTRLPFEMQMMPTALTWRPSGAMVITSLKGRVWQATDSDDDGLEDTVGVIADDVAAPFGVAIPSDTQVARQAVDVVTKYALLRLTDKDGDGEADRWDRMASGWGHTDDYHDWAIGLPQDAEGRYYISTACQQDDRTRAAAKWRGVVMRLTPDTSVLAPPGVQRFKIEQLSLGHRFPIGIARNRLGDLFVTDNQGNFNPFNELNHVQQGKHFGFINKLDRMPNHKPKLTPPAINISHPWTRSVNGICFLESPNPEQPVFGPYEGHLVGCEYDTRRLIRMSLESVGGGMQGAAYPFTRTAEDAEPLLGPLCAAVSPNGELYIGCIRDSGWGGSNNVGTVVQSRPNLDDLPAGIAEVRIAKDGFVIQLHGDLDWKRAADTARYSVSSYRRISTPAYGGGDVDRRDEAILGVVVDEKARQVRVQLNPLRTGFVYELALQNLTENQTFFPASAYYTVNALPID